MKGKNMTKIILADDDPVIVQGLSMIIGSEEGFEIAGTGADGREAVRLARETKPDIAVLDIRMPVMNGIEAAAVMIREELCAPLLLTTFDEPELIADALMVGARGYILKNSPADRILSAIRAVAEGGAVFAPDVIDFIRGMIRAPQKGAPPEDVFANLTPRELEVAALVAEGLSNTRIAERLFLADGTVRNHISAILEKTGLQHRTQIAVKFFARI
ncbi:MAG: response regulator transcription factor [Clostridiales Family XIII bacterium]|jgi:DNA-binding NarL/FixJ family response regulator|nr:response regulator transcription factor [Clostridiales Family XIII bacterium]